MRRDDLENLQEAARIVSNDAQASNPAKQSATKLWERYEKADAKTRAEMRRGDFESLTEAARIVSHGVTPAALKPAPAPPASAKTKAGMSVDQARQLTARYQGASPTIQAIMRKTQGDQLTEAVHIVTESGKPITEAEQTAAQESMRMDGERLLKQYVSLSPDEQILFRQEHAAEPRISKRTYLKK